ncbi:MAG TPA: trypsin-like peptidase domain-containing protein [bacterium]|nr:trypsin-like peptidase domain-containing protein [bacterium]
MKYKSGMVLLAIVVLIGGLLLAFAPAEAKRPTNEQAGLPKLEAPVKSKFTSMAALHSFADLAKRVAPSVVNIYVAKSDRGNRPAPPSFGGMEGMEGQGSGFLIDPAGYIVTNNHVIRGMKKIRVRLLDRREFDARVIGFDKKVDLALIKIEANDLPYLDFGDSDHLEVGEWVIAIGNPFGLSHTVTAGIVSAKGRVLGAGPYDDFIQTDTSINPGNSGGPLINVRGQVVGINTMISASGQGIGFAIPSNLARNIIEQLKEKGHVVRSWLGVYVQPVTAKMAETLGLPRPYGAVVSQVVPNGPAERSGLREGDIIIEFNGRTIEVADDLPVIAASTPAEQTVRVILIRNKKKMSLKIKLETMPENSTPLVPRQ